MLGPIGGPELALIALAIILIFGVGKFSRLGRDLGTSIREFRRAVREDDDEKKESAAPQVQAQAAPPPPPPASQPPASSSGESNRPNVF
ncbi:Sec-independent protein translocase protein TatA [bacterium HR29]|jgi:sec-independent protein translocase protein TatA|nr:Sec-independent protein translocase protein TatA [bacterium HR29]